MADAPPLTDQILVTISQKTGGRSPIDPIWGRNFRAYSAGAVPAECFSTEQQARLERSVPGCAGEGYGVANILHARDIVEKSLEAQAKACVRHSAVTA